MVSMGSQCRTRKATAAELAELDRELGPVDKTSKGMQHGYDEQLLRPHVFAKAEGTHETSIPIYSKKLSNIR